MSVPLSPEREVRFCRSADGVRIAYAVTGDGPTIVKPATWLSHLELDWQSPVWRHLLDELSREHRLVRYDHRGTGLSDRDVEDLSFEAFVADLESVVEAAGLERFALVGISQACAVSIAYAVRHPERVTRLVLAGGYARGWKVRQSEESKRRDEAIATLLREGWGRKHASFRRMFMSLFMPDATDEQMDWFTELQHATASPDNAVRIRDAIGLIDVTELLPRVAAPTLVFHCRDDVVVPFSQGKAVADGIEGARFVPLESRNHLVLEHDPAWKVLSREMRAFLGGRSGENEPPTLQWSRVDALLDKALDVPASERAAFVHEASEGDDALEAEVLRLLELAESEDDDLLAPSGAMFGGVWDDVAEQIEREGQAETFQIGEQVGAYEIRRRLGTGGMGQVYAAVDRRLDREVALKVLPPRLRTEDYRKRFEREAKAIAALNHPNIVHLYSYEEADGVHFITMELVKGRSLSEIIPEKGLPLKTFFEIAVDVVDALAAAHERGIIHRDLKPANVIVNEEGRAKILDFGVAKQQASGPFATDQAMDESATAKGIIVGTVSHMSPEQAEGKELDPRTDLFSLGVCLYEMCTGSRPFTGDSPAAVLSAILAASPRAVDEVNPRLPRELGRIIKRCLAKDRARRYQTALDVKSDLEELQFEVDSRTLFSPSLRAGQSHGRRLVLVAASIAAVLAAVGLVAWIRSASPNARVETPVTGTFEQLTSRQGQETSPSLSPDGRFLVYAGRLGTDWDIFLLRVDGGRPINLTEESEADDTQPVLSPDGERIAFRSARDGGGLFVMGATGEFVRRVTDFGWNPAWSPDGRQLVFATEAISRTPLDRPSTSALWAVDIETGVTRQLIESDGVQPSWSPGGDRIAYWALGDPGGQRDLWTVPAAGGGVPTRVTEDVAVDWNPIWSPDGRYLYFSSDRGGSMNLWRIAIDEDTGRTSGEPEPVTTPSTFAANISFSGDGKTLAFSSTNHSIDLGSIDLTPNTFEVVAGSAVTNREVRDVGSPDPSPNGEWIAFTREGVQEDIVLMRPEGSETRPLTDDPHRDRFPRWSPDGERIAFYSNRGGNYEIWAIDADGGRLEPLTFVGSNVHSPVWSPDGKRIAWARGGDDGGFVDVTVPWSEGDVHLFPTLTEGRENDRFTPMDWSNDGRSILGYAQTPTGMRVGIIVYSIESGTYDYVTNFGAYPRWVKDDQILVFQAQSPERSEAQHDFQQDAKLFIVDRRTKAPRQLFAVPGSSLENPAVTKDGSRIYFAQNTIEADIWIMRFP